MGDGKGGYEQVARAHCAGEQGKRDQRSCDEGKEGTIACCERARRRVLVSDCTDSLHLVTLELPHRTNAEHNTYDGYWVPTVLVIDKANTTATTFVQSNWPRLHSGVQDFQHQAKYVLYLVR